MDGLERAVLEASGRDSEVQRQAMEVQRETMEINREDIGLKRKLFELEIEKTAANIATQRVGVDTSVTWVQAVQEAREMLRGQARVDRESTIARSPSVDV